MISQD